MVQFERVIHYLLFKGVHAVMRLFRFPKVICFHFRIKIDKRLVIILLLLKETILAV